MTDVEKYGLFALVFVISILGLAWLLGPDEVLPARSVALPGGSHSVLLERPGAQGVGQRPRQGLRGAASGRSAASAVKLRDPRAGGASQPRVARYSVAPLIDTQAEFHFDDAPVSYPGERSATLVKPRAGFIAHTIRRNETLSDVSKLYYGSSHEWRRILKANPGLDETRLQVGQVIQVPASATKGAVAGGLQTQGIYVVREGDTLGAIALRELGSTDRTADLFAANRDVMASPDKLKVGMHLRIP